jgi:hypothetical protein
MAISLDDAVLLDCLEDTVRFAAKPSAGVFTRIIAGLGTRMLALDRAGRSAPIGPLLEMQAWTEAALALVQCELPAWQIRRLVHDGADWMCSLSRQPCLPHGLDDGVDATHESLPLAILMAFLEARRRMATLRQASTTIPSVVPAAEGAVCCDNFS